MRVVIADDVMLVRSGLARLLADAGVDVVGEAADGRRPAALVDRERPDVAIVDIRMPPTHTDEGLSWPAASGDRTRHAVVLLSQYLQVRYAERARRPPGWARLPAQGAGVRHRRARRALQRVAEGECVVDPTIVARLMAAVGRSRPWAG